MKLTSCLVKEYKTGNDIALLLLRVVAALVLLYGHGFEKLSVIFSGKEIQFFDPIGLFGATGSFYLAAFAEGICSILLLIGLFSRVATFFLCINFIVIFTFHAFIAKDGFQVLELRFFYLATFLALLLLGPGRLSLDYMLFGKKNN